MYREEENRARGGVMRQPRRRDGEPAPETWCASLSHSCLGMASSISHAVSMRGLTRESAVLSGVVDWNWM